MKFLHNSFFLVFFTQLNFTGDFYALLNNAIVHPSALARELSLVKNEELFSQRNLIEKSILWHSRQLWIDVSASFVQGARGVAAELH